MNPLSNKGILVRSFPDSANRATYFIKHFAVPTWFSACYRRFEKREKQGVLERAPP
jgi:hypothetical protein